jgi:hypothetical protein
MNHTTPAQQFANDVNAVFPLKEGASQEDAAWACVKGSVKKEYYARSPYSSIEAYERGFVVHNFVTGSQHPVATWAKADELRRNITGRYQTISAGPRQW